MVKRDSKINDLVTWVIARLEEFGACELEAVGTAVLTLCHVIARLQKWEIPFDYTCKIGYVWKNEHSIKPCLRVRLWAKERFWDTVKDSTIEREK